MLTTNQTIKLELQINAARSGYPCADPLHPWGPDQATGAGYHSVTLTKS